MTSDSPELYVPALNAILKVVYPIVIAWISSRIIENQAVKRFRSSADGDALLKQVEQTKEIIRDFIDILAGTSKNDAVGVKLDVSRGLPDRGQA